MQIENRVTSDFKLKRNTDAILIKIIKRQDTNSLYAAYSDGVMAVFNLDAKRLHYNQPVYKNSELIDFQFMDDKLVSCTHSQVTVTNFEKNKSISLKGHQFTPYFLSCHPICPLVLSCSNLLLLHDLRIMKPINVNFITPPAYSLSYFPDGQYFLLSGEPSRIGNTCWVRTLVNGMGRVSQTGKHIVLNEMNGKISMWDWRDSQELLNIEKIKNQNVYQNIYFGMKEGKTRKILFVDEQNNFLDYDLLSGDIYRQKLEDMDNSKLYVDHRNQNTNQFFRYTHDGNIQHYSMQI